MTRRDWEDVRRYFATTATQNDISEEAWTKVNQLFIHHFTEYGVSHGIFEEIIAEVDREIAKLDSPLYQALTGENE